MLSSQPQRRLLPSLLGAVGVMLWATETVLITFTTSIPPLQTVALAFAFAALLSPAVWWVTGDDPLAAFRQPLKVWALTVVSLVGYHACIYYATQKAPPAAAALLQGTTPLMIVIGSALLPGERLRWWHLAGSALGLCGVVFLIDLPGDATDAAADPVFYLSVIGIAAALWGLYSVASRSFSDVPTSALGVFYAASALIALLAHGTFETWVQPDSFQWAVIAALGLLPMGLALYLWDYGVKHGDIQALGAFSYVEPFIGAVLVALLGQGSLTWTLFWAGCLVVSGAVLASLGLWRLPAVAMACSNEHDLAASSARPAETAAVLLLTEALRRDLLEASSELREYANRRLIQLQAAEDGETRFAELAELMSALRRADMLWEQLLRISEAEVSTADR